MLTVTLFTRDGCGLCDEIVAELDSLSAEFPHQLTKVDITQDDALFDRYRYTIPVLHIGDQELQAPITRQMLKTALISAE